MEIWDQREMEIYKQQNETVSATNPLFNTWLFKRYGILWALKGAWPWALKWAWNTGLYSGRGNLDQSIGIADVF